MPGDVVPGVLVTLFRCWSSDAYTRPLYTSAVHVRCTRPLYMSAVPVRSAQIVAHNEKTLAAFNVTAPYEDDVPGDGVLVIMATCQSTCSLPAGADPSTFKPQTISARLETTGLQGFQPMVRARL
jgi:hypothetical protein